MKMGGKTHRLEDVETSMGSLFIDSGAHSLYNREADNGSTRTDAKTLADKYVFFDLKKGSAFRKFLHAYVRFIREHEKSVDFYVTLDAIYHPQRTWDITMCLEEEYGLKPVPVIHCHAPMKWIARYIERGHRFIGIGGLGQGITKQAFLGWGDKVFHYLCPVSSNKLPVVKTHGFAMTSWELLLRYPWWSVDSASWLKAAAFGQIYIPHKRDGQFVFSEPPYSISISNESPNLKVRNKHVLTLPAAQRKIAEEWFALIGVDFTERPDMTASDRLAVRARTNLLYFTKLCETHAYPRPFMRRKPEDGFGLVGGGSEPPLPAGLAKRAFVHNGDHLHVYFSGLSGGGVYPEVLIRERNPEVMLSFDNLRQQTEGATAWRRFNAHRKNLGTYEPAQDSKT